MGHLTAFHEFSYVEPENNTVYFIIWRSEMGSPKNYHCIVNFMCN